MPKYKVGDVPALLSTPKEPTTKSGKTLQSLFKVYHMKNKSENQNQEAASELNAFKSKAVSEESKNQRIPKKNKKRKLSMTTDSELNISSNQNLKKIKRADGQEIEIENKEKKNNNYLEKGNIPKKKKKATKLNSSSCNSLLKTETNDNSKNKFKSEIVSKLSNSPKSKKAIGGFIKKSKHQVNEKSNTFDKCHNVNSKAKAKEFNDEDTLLRNEISDFIRMNSKMLNESSENFKNELQNQSEKVGEDFAKIKPKKSNKNKSSENSKNELQDQSKVGEDFAKIKPKKSNKKSNLQNQSKKVGEDFAKIKPKKSSKKKSSENSINELQDQSKVGEDFAKMKPKKSNKKSNVNVNSEEFSEQPKSNVYTSIANFNSNHKSEDYEQTPGFIRRPKKQKVFGGRKSDFTKPSETDERLGRTLYVGNLPVKSRIKDLKALFSKFGEVDYIRFTGIETDKAKIFSTDAPKSLSRNYASDSAPGFVVFKEREGAVKALSLSGTVYKSHHITVDFAAPAGSKKFYDERLSIFIGNVPYVANDESIWDAFSSCGKIDRVRIVRDKTTGLGKGFGFVLFHDEESRKNALNLDDLKIAGRSIKIKATDSVKRAQKKLKKTTDTFKSRAMSLKKKRENSNMNSRKSVKKLVKREKSIHKKKKIASLLKKSMK